VVAEVSHDQPAPWLTPSEQEVWRRLLFVQCRLREQLDRELQAGGGLTLGEYDVLVHLSEAPGRALRMSELADRLLLSRSGLTRRVDGLVRHGLVTRRPCDDDGRGAIAELTETGLAALERAVPVHAAGIRRYLLDPLRAPGAQPPWAARPVDGGPDTGGLSGLAEGLIRIERALIGR
jgi:DNA-binding MarR family transcriptional regulator